MAGMSIGRKCTPETRAKISATLTGRKLSPEHIAKMSAAMMGKQNALGRKASPEQRARHAAMMSARHRRNRGGAEPPTRCERRAKGVTIMRALTEWLTDAEWQQILADHDYTCAYCGRRGGALQREHQIPLSQGGTDTVRNVVPACGPCNQSKGVRTAYFPRDVLAEMDHIWKVRIYSEAT